MFIKNKKLSNLFITLFDSFNLINFYCLQKLRTCTNLLITLSGPFYLNFCLEKIRTLSNLLITLSGPLYLNLCLEKIRTLSNLLITLSGSFTPLVYIIRQRQHFSCAPRSRQANCHAAVQVRTWIGNIELFSSVPHIVIDLSS